MASSFDMDQLTMEYFTNKSVYNKYLAKKDPTTFHKNEEFIGQLQRNHTEVMTLISTFILDPESIPPSKLRQLFFSFMIECLEKLEKEEDGEQEQEVEEEVNKEEDVMFSRCEDLGTKPKNQIEYWKMQKLYKLNA